MDSETMEFIGGPMDGHVVPYVCNPMSVVTVVRPIRHHWYEHRAYGRMVNNERQTFSQWHYVGLGSLRGPWLKSQRNNQST